jgi:hypothetical protein
VTTRPSRATLAAMKPGPRRSAGPEPTSAPDGAGAHVGWAVALLAAVAPLWAARNLPLVDLPQHFYILDVLKRLHDPATVYPHYFELRPGWNPYIGYYDALRLLGLFMPVELANRIFLTACVAGIPLALAFLLRSLRRPAWPALLAIPLAYGDSFAWGFINYCAALPLAFLSLGLFVRTLADALRRARWALLTAVSLLGVFAFHPVPVGFLAIALPLLLATTRLPEDDTAAGFAARLRPRLPALAALLPVAVLGVAWFVAMAGHPESIAASAPGAGRGPLFSVRNLEFQGLGQNLEDFSLLLTNMMQDGSDRWGLNCAVAIGLAAVGAWALGSRAARRQERWPARASPFSLVALAFGLYLALPLHIHGYINHVGPRLAPVAAGLAVGLVPRLGPRAARAFLGLAVACSLLTAWPLVRGFRDFDREARTLDPLAEATGERPVIMGLMFDNHSRVVHESVYIHAAVELARRRGGIPDYTFAGGPQAPICYRAAPPPALVSGWHPELFDYDTQGRAYDHFLVRGLPPERVFGARLETELYVAAHSGDFWLVRRRR